MTALSLPTVLVADDHRGQAQVLLDLISRRYYGVAAAECVNSLRAQLQVHRPDIAIVDVRMHEDVNILDVLPELREISPDTGFILWTGFPGWAPAGKAFAIGVRGYLVKPVEMEELVTAIEVVHCGRSYLTRDRLLRDRTRILAPSGALSEAKLKVFNLRRRGFTNAQVGLHLGKSESTVEKQVTDIRACLGISMEPSYTEWEKIVCPTIDGFGV